MRRQEGKDIRSPKHHRKEPCLGVVPLRRRAFVHHFLHRDKAEGADDAYHDAHKRSPRDPQAEMADLCKRDREGEEKEVEERVYE